MKILCISPHVDDVELALGGTIAKLSREHEISILYLSLADISNQGYDMKDEASHATDAYSLNYFANFRVRKFDEQISVILDRIHGITEDTDYDRYYIPCQYMLHQDHQVTHRAAMAALKHRRGEIIGYQLFHDQQMIYMNHRSRFNVDDLHRKLVMLRAYKSQKHKYYFQEPYIRAQYELVGGEPICPIRS